MAKIKVNRSWKRPSWDSVNAHSLYEYEKAIGTKHMLISGMIGYGNKIHKFHMGYIDTDEGIGIVYLYSFCGSKKWNSYLHISFINDLSIVNCERCIK